MSTGEATAMEDVVAGAEAMDDEEEPLADQPTSPPHEEEPMEEDAPALPVQEEEPTPHPEDDVAVAPEYEAPEDDVQMKPPVTFDVGAVAAQASHALQEGGAAGVDEGRRAYAEALFAWEDEVAENPDEASASAVVDLWLSYAMFEQSLKQWKQAVQVFESASESPIASASEKFWLEYASFCADRNKLENAKLVFGRALDSVRDPANVWDAYLQFHRQVLGDDATMEELRKQHRGDDPPAPSKTKRKRAHDFFSDSGGGEDFSPAQDKQGPSREETAAAATAESEEEEDSSEEEEPEEDDEEDPSLAKSAPAFMLFGREPIRESDAEPSVTPEEMKQFISFASEPTALDIVEALRVTDLLATSEIEETWASMRYLQAAKLRDAVHDPTLLADVVAEIRAEHDSLAKRTATELVRLNADIYAALTRAGVPTFRDEDAANDARRITQKNVLRATLATNLRAQHYSSSSSSRA
mmetsp:Transcript_11504/g.34400  ORF Transcript_11504/g.34400 Transcript_11504/m.34400 type:complete len:470 (-) Transcript_11504:757-2166(-)